MRKIEQQMIAAVQNNINWSSANTTVHFNEETGESIVRLHGNKIAVVSDTDMTIFDGGYQSVTTKSRLNALCQEFCVAGEGVFQKDFAWYVRKFVGAINGQSKFVTETFNNGYIFAWDDYTERLTLSPYNLHPPFFTLSTMKTVLVIIIGVLLWQSTDARKFTANVLQSASDIIEPDVKKNQTIGERIDSFLDWYMGTLALHR